MLFKQQVLDRIAAGEITLAFRYWKRPTVKPGGSLHTAVGVLAIDAVDAVAMQAITAAEARCAGFATLAALQADLAGPRGGASGGKSLYRIAFHLAGADPRIALRNDDRLPAAQLAEIVARLDRFERTTGGAPWTRRVLARIGARDGLTAGEMAADLGVEKADLKRRIRKLKELGLTESLVSGYRLSPRGRALLDKLSAE